MPTPDITKAIASNDIKNGASLLLVNKTGIETIFDNSKDIEQGLEALANETTNRFDDREYYFSSTSSGVGNSFNQNLNTTDSPSFNKISVSSGIMFNDGSIQITAASGISGPLVIPSANIDLHNGGIQSAQVLQFDNNSKQSVITGPTPAASGDTAQRLIIQGQRAQGNGEGGDVYLWGGDSDVNGGDIKIYAGDADSNESGQGGYINIDAGNGHNQGGQVSISAGNSNLQGGNVNISAGYPSGIVAINADGGGSRWEFKPDGKVFLPMSALDVGGDTIDIKSSNYVELWYHSGPSGTPNNYIENPNNNSDTYLWTEADGTWIANYRDNDGTNPAWVHEWHFGNDGKLTHPDGTTSSGGTIVAPGTYNIQSVDNTLIQTSAAAQAKSWNFDTNGDLTLPQGGTLTETNNTVAIAPPTAAVGQSLVIRPTQATWGMSTSNYIEYGNPITISVTLQNWAYFGTVNYTISGTGVTPQSLGRALTGKLTFVSTSAPDTETITWTIPANSNITEFTLTLTSVDGTRPGPDVADANLYPALYYNFEESNGMPTGQFITVTNNAMVNSEHSHVHLLSGDPATVDLYLGDDDQYVKIQKNGGDVVVGTKSETVVNRLTLITSGTGYAVTPNDVAALGGSGTGMRVNYANNGGSVIVVVINTLGTGYQDGDILTLSGGNGNCTFRYTNHDAIHNNWTFGTNGKLTLPIDGDIVDSNGTSVLGGGSTTVVSSSYSSTINTDAGAGDIFDITLTGNTTLANPTNPVNGKTLRWRITQDSTGSRTVTLGNKFNIPSSATSPLPFSTAANKMDMLAATYHAGRDKWDVVAFVPGY
jgi:hypothetical protein